MTQPLTAHVDEVAALLAAIEVEGTQLRVVKNLAEVEGPRAWVALASLDPTLLSGDDEANVLVFLVGAPTDEYRALEQLTPYYAAVRGALQPNDVVTVVGVRPTNGQQELPALRIPIRVTP